MTGEATQSHRSRCGRTRMPDRIAPRSSYAEKLALDGIAPSIGPVGDAYDSALMETITGLHKAECVRTTVFHEGPYKTIADGEYATAGWVDWHNHRRLHGSLGMANPNEFEQAHHAALTQEPLPRTTAAKNLRQFTQSRPSSHDHQPQDDFSQSSPMVLSGVPSSSLRMVLVAPAPRSPNRSSSPDLRSSPWTPRRWTQNHHALQFVGDAASQSVLVLVQRLVVAVGNFVELRLCGSDV